MHEGRILLLQHTGGGRRREHHGDLVLFDDLPPDTGIRTQRRAFVHNRRHAGDQRAVDDVGVADHPADIGGREEGFALATAVDMLHRRSQRHGVTAGVALHALRLASRARGVKDVGRFRGFHPLAWHLSIHELGTQSGVVDIATSDFVISLVQTTINHQHLGRLAFGQINCLIKQMLVGHSLATAHTGVGGNNQRRLGIIDPGSQRTGGKTTKND